tara:strand:+ start:604 stop:1791 length:1188 start_codon:yes stop_codon:yes gene_type:complete
MAPLASLPPGILCDIVLYARPCKHPPWSSNAKHGPSLQDLMRIGRVCKSFLAALKYVSTLRLDLFLTRAKVFTAFNLIGSGYDVHVRRWCEIASRRLQNVRRIETSDWPFADFNSNQTQMIVNCAASFSNLEHMIFYGGEVCTLCVSIAANVRAGRFSRLKRLVLESRMSLSRYRNVDGPTNSKQQAKIAFRDLISQLPADRGLDILLYGLYPRIMKLDRGDFRVWDSELSELLARSQLNSRPILVELCDQLEELDPDRRETWLGDDNRERLETFYRTVEDLLVVQKVDPNVCQWDFPFEGQHSTTVLFSLLNTLDYTAFWSAPRRDPGHFEPLLRYLMRYIDLLVQHGAVSGTGKHDAAKSLSNWMLQRPDCTPHIREAAARGDLMFPNADDVS